MTPHPITTTLEQAGATEVKLRRIEEAGLSRVRFKWRCLSHVVTLYGTSHADLHARVQKWVERSGDK